MRVFADFRFLSRDASLLSGHVASKPGEIFSKLVVEVGSEQYAEIGRLHRERVLDGDFFFSSWNLRRIYDQTELAACLALHCWWATVSACSAREVAAVLDQGLERADRGRYPRARLRACAVE